MADRPADVRISKKFTNVACITNQAEQGSVTPLAFEYLIIHNPGSSLTDRQNCIRATALPATSNKHSYCHLLITSSTRYIKWASSMQLWQAESLLRRRTKTLPQQARKKPPLNAHHLNHQLLWSVNSQPPKAKKKTAAGRYIL